jgi:hypothetical protein
MSGVMGSMRYFAGGLVATAGLLAAAPLPKAECSNRDKVGPAVSRTPFSTAAIGCRLLLSCPEPPCALAHRRRPLSDGLGGMPKSSRRVWLVRLQEIAMQMRKIKQRK